MARYQIGSVRYGWNGKDKTYLVSAGSGMVCGKEGRFFTVPVQSPLYIHSAASVLLWEADFPSGAI
jgi:hypothetical protein